MIKGEIIRHHDGTLTYEGHFWTPRSPTGKEPKDLDDAEKANFEALLANEIHAVDEYHDWLKRNDLLAMSVPLPSDIYVAVHIRGPRSAVPGSVASYDAPAAIWTGGRATVFRYSWELSNGNRTILRTNAARFRYAFREPGEYRLRAVARDRFGAIGTAVIGIRVQPRGRSEIPR